MIDIIAVMRYKHPIMAKVKKEHKERLMKLGKWVEFITFRDRLKTEGVPNALANKRAIESFLGAEAASSVYVPEAMLEDEVNADNGSVIDGESTTGDAGRGDRRTAMFIDEYAAFDVTDGYRVLLASRDTTNCRGFNSTPESQTTHP